MSESVYQAVEVKSLRGVGPLRYRAEAAKIDADWHVQKTGNDCMVCKIKVIWATSHLDDLLEEAAQSYDMP